ncbi:MAG TPA: hypothetical protein VG797_11570 [Phycisphaerales bacterium]|nr:hypothetical protein [Phycisphaerales bacterium]
MTKWRLRCTSCGRVGPLPAGMIRIGAASWGKVILGRCSACGKLRAMAVEPDRPVESPNGAAANGQLTSEQLADRDRTWTELVAFVSEGTITSDLAQQIYESEVPEHRKREAAAHIAEGSMKGEEAIKMLKLGR